MSELVLFVLSSYGLWYVFSTADLPVWGYVRDDWLCRVVQIAKFFHCPICSGFWISWGVALLFPLGPNDGPLGSLVQAFAGAAAIYLIETHVRRLEER